MSEPEQEVSIEHEDATMTKRTLGRVLFGLSLFLCLSLTCSSAFATFRGEPDAGRHPYAGLAFIYVPNDGNYITCSGSLVHAPQLPERRVFLTAGHCIFFAQAAGTRWSVTFDETPLMVFGIPNSRFPTSLSPDPNYTFTGTGYTDFSTRSNGVGFG